MRHEKLWEEIFPEDTKAFLDYYYYIKAAKNQIYVVEEDGRICSMLQLNPYRIRLEDKAFRQNILSLLQRKRISQSRIYAGAAKYCFGTDAFGKKCRLHF